MNYNLNELLQDERFIFGIGVAAFCLWCAIAIVLKDWLFRILRRNWESSENRLDVILIRALNAPINLFIVFIGLLFMEKVFPLDAELGFYLAYSIKIILILIGIFIIDRAIIALMTGYGKRDALRNLSQTAVQGFVRSIIFIVGSLVLLDNFGVNVTPIVASLGIGSLAVALALQPALSNLFSGLMVSMDGSMKVGDLIEIENGQRGYIEDISWRTTRLRMINENLMVIPNSKLVDNIITNLEIPDRGMRTYIECGVHYKSDLDHVEKVVLDVARKVIDENPGADPSFEPWMSFREFSDSSIKFRLIVKCSDFLAQFSLNDKLIKAIHARFKEEGIVIPFPIRTLDISPGLENLMKDIEGKS